jgi:hypothetical protein
VRSRYSDCLQAERPRGRSSSPDRGKFFLFSVLSRRVLTPTQPPMHQLQKTLPPGLKRPRCEADVNYQLVSKSRIRGPIHPHPHTSSCCSAELVKHRLRRLFHVLCQCFLYFSGHHNLHFINPSPIPPDLPYKEHSSE